MADEWDRVAAALNRAVTASPLTKSAIVEQAGVDYRSFNKALAGEPISPALRKRIAIGLGWTPDSIDRLLAGDEPQRAGNDVADTTDLGSRIARLSPNAQQVIKDIIDAEERRMGT